MKPRRLPKLKKPDLRFSSLSELAAYTRGKSWDEFWQAFSDDYQALGFLQRVPWRQRGKLYPNDVRYEAELAALYRFVHGDEPSDKDAIYRGTLEQIRKELESRNQWQSPRTRRDKT